MSDENVEAVRRSFDLWLSGEVDAWRETLDPNVGWDIPRTLFPMFRITVAGAMRCSRTCSPHT